VRNFFLAIVFGIAPQQHLDAFHEGSTGHELKGNRVPSRASIIAPT
jgi:hypothetical protein